MDITLIIAAFLIVFAGVAHSLLGEKFLIRRLMRHRDLPELFGSVSNTKQTIRFAWHLTTIVWFGLAHILLVHAGLIASYNRMQSILFAISFTFLASAVLSLIFTRGRHFYWIVFLIISLMCFVKAL